MFQLSNYKDVDNTVADIITEFYALMDDGEYDKAHRLLERNEEILRPYYINASSFNKIEHGIYDLSLAHEYEQKIIVSATEPVYSNLHTGSEWLQEY